MVTSLYEWKIFKFDAKPLTKQILLKGGGGVSCACKASALDVGSGITIQRYSFFEINIRVFTFMQRSSPVFISYTFLLGRFIILLNVSTIPWTCNNALPSPTLPSTRMRVCFIIVVIKVKVSLITLNQKYRKSVITNIKKSQSFEFSVSKNICLKCEI